MYLCIRCDKKAIKIKSRRSSEQRSTLKSDKFGLFDYSQTHLNNFKGLYKLI